MAPERRYPILLAALTNTTWSRRRSRPDVRPGARRDRQASPASCRQRQLAIAGADVERLVLLDEILDVVFDEDLDDAARSGTGFAASAPNGSPPPPEAPTNGSVRRRPLAAEGRTLQLTAVPSPPQCWQRWLRRQRVAQRDPRRRSPVASDERRRQAACPAGAPMGFVPARWQPYLAQAAVAGHNSTFKHYWELCVLFALRGALRSGEIWVKGSRRYADPASYLIPPAVWPTRRDEVLELTGNPARFGDRLAEHRRRPRPLLDDLDTLLADATARSGSTSRASCTSARSPPRSSTPRSQLERTGSWPVCRWCRWRSCSSRSTRTPASPTSHPRRRRQPTNARRARTPPQPLRRHPRPGQQLRHDPHGRTHRYQSRHARLVHPAGTCATDHAPTANATIVNAHHRHPLAQAWGAARCPPPTGCGCRCGAKSLTARGPVAVLRRRRRHRLPMDLRSAHHLRHPDHRAHRTRRPVHPRRDPRQHHRAAHRRTRHRHPRPAARHVRAVRPRRAHPFPPDRQAHRTPAVAPPPARPLRPLAPSRSAPRTPRPGRSHRPTTGTSCCGSPAPSTSATSPPPCSSPDSRPGPVNTPSPRHSSNTASSCAPSTPFAGSPMRRSAAASAASSTKANPSTTCAASWPSPTPATSATATTTTRPASPLPHRS